MMEIRYGPSEEEFRSIVTIVGHERYADNLEVTNVQEVRTLKDGRHVIRGRVRAIDSGFQTRPRDTDYLAPGARRSWSGRRQTAACWHAYRDVLAELFRRYPRATVITSMARYDGREGFERNYLTTADINIGSQMQPAYMPELCDWDGMSSHNPPVPRFYAHDGNPSGPGGIETLCPDIATRIAAVEQESSA
jgi:hypothetical protein